MWVRKRIDIGWLDLLSAVVNGFLPGSRASASNETEAAWSNDGRAFVCLSVRTGLDLVLKGLELPIGSEVLVSAITIPDMVRIIEHHGLVAVPIDLHANDMSPRADLLEKVLTSKTKALLVAQLLGARFSLAPFVKFARQHGLVLLEDCAQAFEGDRYRGSDEADVSMFSFGPIKTATALGGGLLRVRDQSLFKQIRELQSKYPVQSRWFFLKRTLFYSVLKWLGGRIIFAFFFRTCHLFGKNVDEVLNGSIRNFPRAEFFNHLREQPSLPLLRLITRRITKYRNEDLDRRAARGHLLASLLPTGSCPGSEATPHSFWVFPVQVPDVTVYSPGTGSLFPRDEETTHSIPNHDSLENRENSALAVNGYVPDQSSAIIELQKAGFDSTANNSLQPVEPPQDRPELEPLVARGLLARAIYLPMYSAMPESEIRRMASVLK